MEIFDYSEAKFIPQYTYFLLFITLRMNDATN